MEKVPVPASVPVAVTSQKFGAVMPVGNGTLMLTALPAVSAVAVGGLGELIAVSVLPVAQSPCQVTVMFWGVVVPLPLLSVTVRVIEVGLLIVCEAMVQVACAAGAAGLHSPASVALATSPTVIPPAATRAETASAAARRRDFRINKTAFLHRLGPHA